MPITSTKNQLQQILGFKTDIDKESSKSGFYGVEFDSRNIRGGEMFIALPGQNIHGNIFAQKAIENGAALALVEEEVFPEELSSSLLVVKDSLEAFTKISSWWREEVGLPLAAITGSVGKTTVKEMLANILLQTGIGCYSKKSFNNHVGVPYTLCQISRNHNWAVVEMGMNHSGEIQKLTKIASPDLVAITKIAPAHIENFGTLEKIAQAKLEILEGLKSNGKVILNADDAVLMSEYQKLNRNKEEFLTFGTTSEATMQVANINSMLLEGITFDLIENDTVLNVKMKIIGRHHALNACCAALCAKTLLPDIKFEQIVRGLERFTAPLMRMFTTKLKNGTTLVDDSYNANLESMNAMLNVAKEYIDKKIKVGLIIGDMLELGDFSNEAHMKTAQLIKDINPLFCFCVGKESRVIFELLTKTNIKTKLFSDVQNITTDLQKIKFDILFLKGSRGIGLNAVADDLIKEYGIQE